MLSSWIIYPFQSFVKAANFGCRSSRSKLSLWVCFHIYSFSSTGSSEDNIGDDTILLLRWLYLIVAVSKVQQCSRKLQPSPWLRFVACLLPAVTATSFLFYEKNITGTNRHWNLFNSDAEAFRQTPSQRLQRPYHKSFSAHFPRHVRCCTIHSDSAPKLP